MKKYNYFVSFNIKTKKGGFGFGCQSVEWENKITSMKDLSEVRDYIQKGCSEFESIVILFYREF